MFIWRNLSPQCIVDCIEHFYPGAWRDGFDDGEARDGAGGMTPLNEPPVTPGSSTPPKA